MAKITLASILTAFASAVSLNSRFSDVESHLNDKVLYRDNVSGEANDMKNDLDMNSNRILNLPTAVSGQDPVTYAQWIGGSSNVTITGTLAEEQVAATDGQVLYTLSAITYEPGIKALTVIRNGSPLPYSAYTDTSSTSVTLLDGSSVKAGDEFDFRVNERNVTGDAVSASSVTYTPSGSTATNVASYLNAQGPDTLNDLVTSTEIVEGMLIYVKERTAGNGGGAWWKTVFSTSVTENTYNIVQCTGIGTLSIVLSNHSDGIVKAKEWGYIADGTTANQDVVLQFIIDLYTTTDNTSGVTIDLGHGSGILSAELLISSPNIRFIGTGKRNVYLENNASVPGPAVASADSKTTLFGVHSDRNLIRFHSSVLNWAGTFSAEGVNFATLEAGSVPTACFGFDGSGQFHRDYTFMRCGMFGFSAVYDMYDATGTGTKQFAGLKSINCNINRNGHIAINSNSTQWNGFLFQQNEAGQNGVTTGEVINLRGQDIVINDGNILEGQPNTIRVAGNYKGTIIEGNYFEANSGDYVITLEQTIGSRVGPNFYQAITATDEVLLFSCPSPIINEIGINVNMDGCINPTTAQGQIGLPTEDSFLDGSSVLLPWERVAHRHKRGGGKTLYFGTISAVTQSFHNIDDSGAALYTTTGTGIISKSAASKTYADDDIICAVSIVSYDDEPVIAPRLVLNINANADGGSSGIFNNHAKAGFKYKNNTFVLMSFCRTNAAGTATVLAQLYPFGLSPTAGLTCTHSTFIWNLGQASEMEGLTPFVSPEQWERAPAAPLSGAWNAGDSLKLQKGLGSAGGTEGFYCTVAGSPGTWKTSGSITA